MKNCIVTRSTINVQLSFPHVQVKLYKLLEKSKIVDGFTRFKLQAWVVYVKKSRSGMIG